MSPHSSSTADPKTETPGEIGEGLPTVRPPPHPARQKGQRLREAARLLPLPGRCPGATSQLS